MTIQTTKNPLGFEKISTLLRKFAVPSIVAMLVGSLYNIVDQIFIGQGVGVLGNAATNVAFPTTTISLAISLLIGVGAASRYSLCLGSGNKEKATHAVGNSIMMMVISGLIYFVILYTFLPQILKAFGATETVLPYALEYTRITAFGFPMVIITIATSNLIRADGSPNYSMFTMILGGIVNTILDPIFIFGLNMGMAGAAIATVIGQLCSFVLAVRYLTRFKNIDLSRQHFKLNLSEVVTIAGMGMSNSINQVSLTFVQIIANNSLTYYGALSKYGADIPLAAAGIVFKVNALVLSVIIGLSQGLQPIVGYNYGAKKYDRVEGAYKLAIKSSLVITTLSLISYQFFPEKILSLFGSGNDLYFDFAIRFMRTYLLLVMCAGIQMISSNFFAAIGKPLKGMILSLTRQVLFLIPLLIVLPLFFQIYGIMYAAPVADLSSFIVTSIFISKELKLMEEEQRLLQGTSTSGTLSEYKSKK
ncbi:MAG: MATE family efflux transporter [Eubacteriaceae bacterium]|jgi:putative MATE family efflux protein|nr:MATE family efflux transporter [Eubacteriaceae bacterium]